MICKHVVTVVGLIVLAPGLVAHGDDPWRRDADLQKALAASIDIRSSNEPLREFLTRLSQSQRVAFFLDRRLDPSTPHSFASQGQSLKSIFYAAAASEGGGAIVLGDCVYVGPGEVVAVLPEAMAALRGRVKNLPPDAKKIWQRPEAWHIPRLSRPANLVSQLAAAQKLNVVGLDKIPHDLWPEMNLPPMTLSERFAALLLGFGLWPEISAEGDSVQIVEFVLPDSVTLTHSTKQSDKLSEWIRQTCPSAKLVRKSGALVVTASPQDQHAIGVWLADNETTGAAPSAEAKKVVTLNATASAGSIATQVAAQLGVELVFDPSLQKQLEKRVEVHVDQVPYPELLEKVFADTGLSFQLDDRQLRIFAK